MTYLELLDHLAVYHPAIDLAVVGGWQAGPTWQAHATAPHTDHAHAREPWPSPYAHTGQPVAKEAIRAGVPRQLAQGQR